MITDDSKPEVNALVVSPPAPVWGAQLYLLDQVPALRERGVSLTLASPRGTPFADLWAERGHPVVDLPLELHTGLREAGSTRRPSLRRVLAAVPEIVKGTIALSKVARDYDLVYSFALRSHVEVTLAGKVARRPVVLDLVNIVRPGIGRQTLRFTSRLAALTVANSRASAAVLPAAAKMRVIHPGVDLDRFGPDHADPSVRSELSGGVERPLVAIVGRIDVRKGVQVLVEAMGRLTGPAAGARLVIVGEAGTGPQEFADELRRRAETLLGDRVLFAGRREDIPAVMCAVDALVVASVAEPFGLTALEAQACRTPVIGTDSGGLVEFVEDQVTGLLVRPGDPESMARAIERILTDSSLRESIIDEAYRQAVPARGVAAQADEIADMYRSVVGAGRREPEASSAEGNTPITTNHREEVR